MLRMERIKRKSKAGLDRIKHGLVDDVIFTVLDANITKTTVELRRSTTPGSNDMIEGEVLEALKHAKVVNWCRTVSTMVPIKIQSPGQ